MPIRFPLNKTKAPRPVLIQGGALFCVVPPQSFDLCTRGLKVRCSSD